MTLEHKHDFLRRAHQAAVAALHPWPAFAACEAALESAWGTSALATQANNLLGQKQGKKAPLPYPCFDLLTEEVLSGGQRVKERATWLVFPDWQTAFRERMALLSRLKAYAPALTAATGEDFVRQVSRVWSTDPQRAVKVLTLYRLHQEFLERLDGSARTNS